MNVFPCELGTSAPGCGIVLNIPYGYQWLPMVTRFKKHVGSTHLADTIQSVKPRGQNKAIYL